MNVGYVTIGLVILGVVACAIGAFGIAKYAFRVSSTKGALALLFPPYTFYFSFFELQEEGKERPIALWVGGLVMALLIGAAFWQPIAMVFAGQADQLYPPAADEIEKQYGAKPVSAELSKPIAELDVPEAPTAGTNNTASAVQGATANPTNNVAPATNGAATNAAPAP